MDVYPSEFMKQNHQPSIIKKLPLILMSALAVSLSGLHAASEPSDAQQEKNVYSSNKISLKQVPLQELNATNLKNMVGLLGIEYTAIGDDYLAAKMPVNHQTKQCIGNLHGGASVVLAETVGLTAANLLVNNDQYCVPVSTDSSHVRKVIAGENVYVYARAIPLRVSTKTQTWQIRITNDDNQLVSVTTLTLEIRDKQDHTKSEQQSSQLSSQLPNDNSRNDVCLSTNIPLALLNKKVGSGNMVGWLGIQFTDISKKSLSAKMPVNNTTQQPMEDLRVAYGVLAETVGTVAANLAVDHRRFTCVGMAINVSRIRQIPPKEYVSAVATPLHVGNTTHVWQVEITDEQNQLVCISRLTAKIIPNKQ